MTRALRTAASIAAVLFSAAAAAQFLEAPTDPPPSMKTMPLPTIRDQVSGLPLVDESADGAGGFIKDVDAAIRLGKALFWDQQLGSDGIACASCHFHAGADSRSVNQLSTGFKGGNALFDPTGSGGQGPNLALSAADFPFHKLADPADRDSAVLFDTDDVASSSGTFAQNFNDIVEGQMIDDCTVIKSDPAGFRIRRTNTRRVEPRNTPTVINAAFNDRNFWDGRANNIFNGVNPFGYRDPDARVLEVQPDDSVQKIRVGLENSSLASQVVGPPLSDFEMSCGGRSFPKVGKKMLSLTPLGFQTVHPGDSVLGGLADAGGGLATSYQAMIQAAIADRFWDSDVLVDAAGNIIGSGAPASTDQFTLMEANFALIMGLAVQEYERTLISDDTPFDQFQEGNDAALTQDQKDGMDLFFTNTIGQRGLCVTCHQGPTFTTAAFPFQEERESGEFPEVEERVERMPMGDGVTILEDLFQYWVRGAGTVGGIQLEGFVGSRRIPARFPAAVGGHFRINGCEYRVLSFLLDTDIIPGSDPPQRHPSRDALFRLEPMDAAVCGNPGSTVFVIDNKLQGTPDYVAVMSGDDFAFGNLSEGDLEVGTVTLYDTAFYNIGIRPPGEDPGVGADDPFGNPLSFTKQWINKVVLGGTAPDDFTVNPSNFHFPFSWFGDGAFFPGGLTGPLWPVATFIPPTPPPVTEFVEGYGQEAIPKNVPENAAGIADMNLGIMGAFKVPGLRNVELTGPYFHNGGQRTLKEVVEFYNRGADFALENVGDLSPNIHPLGLSDAQLDLLVEFMRALTDERVRCELAPFDHPSLKIPNGHQTSARTGRLRSYPSPSDADFDLPNGLGLDDFIDLPAVGAGGLPAENLPCIQGFLE